MLIIHTSTPSFANDVTVAEAFKAENPGMLVGFVGAKVAVQPKESLERGAVVDFVAGNEFDFTIKEIAEGKPLAEVAGIMYRAPDGTLVKNPDRAILHDMDQLPFVTDVYAKHLRIEDYFIGYLLHPYVSMYTAAAANPAAPSASGRKPSAATPTAPARSKTSSPKSSARRSCFRRSASSCSMMTRLRTTCRAPRRSRKSSANWV